MVPTLCAPAAPVIRPADWSAVGWVIMNPTESPASPMTVPSRIAHWVARSASGWRHSTTAISRVASQSTTTVVPIRL